MIRFYSITLFILISSCFNTFANDCFRSKSNNKKGIKSEFIKETNTYPTKEKREVKYLYDQEGRILKRSLDGDECCKETIFEYDQNGNLLRTIDSDKGNLIREIQNKYNNGNLIQIRGINNEKNIEWEICNIYDKENRILESLLDDKTIEFKSRDTYIYRDSADIAITVLQREETEEDDSLKLTEKKITYTKNGKELASLKYDVKFSACDTVLGTDSIELRNSRKITYNSNGLPILELEKSQDARKETKLEYDKNGLLIRILNISTWYNYIEEIEYDTNGYDIQHSRYNVVNGKNEELSTTKNIFDTKGNLISSVTTRENKIINEKLIEIEYYKE